MCFEKPSDLFFDDCKNLVGCSKLILDSSGMAMTPINHQILAQLAVKDDKGVERCLAVEQLLTVCKEKDQKKNYTQTCIEEAVVEKIYAFMNKCATDDVGSFQEEIKPLENGSIILIDSELHPVAKVAFTIGYNCTPELYEIGKKQD